MDINFLYRRDDSIVIFDMTNIGHPIYRDDPRYAEVEAYLAENPEALVPEPVPPPPTPEALASQARALRDARLVANDRQIIIASRAQRTGDTTATVRLAALDAYAVALCDWPESEGFPDLSTIPVTPIIN